MPIAIGTLDSCFESAAISYQRWQVASDGRGARFARQTNTSVGVNTGQPQARRWALSAQLATQAQFEYLEARWAESRGGVLSHTWTPPDESTPIVVRIDSYRPVYAAHGRFEVALEVEEEL